MAQLNLRMAALPFHNRKNRGALGGTENFGQIVNPSCLLLARTHFEESVLYRDRPNSRISPIATTLLTGEQLLLRRAEIGA